MEFLNESDIVRLSISGVVSEQLLSPHNSQSERVTVTRVMIQSGAIQSRHAHGSSEQIWIALGGSGLLLLAENKTRPFRAGEIARFADGVEHGFENTGSEVFIYMSITSPPINFDQAYGAEPRTLEKQHAQGTP